MGRSSVSRPRPRRRFRAAALVASAALLGFAVAACGGDTSDDAGAPSAGSPAAGAFPVEIAHKYGSTTIKAEPKRVVTVGLVEQDALLALGVVPVATTEWLGQFPGAIGPWASDRLGGAALPQVLQDTGDGPQFERIAALKPDLILALYSGLDQQQYDTLAQIAPTVAQPKEHVDYGVPWDELTRTVGRAVGRAEQAERLVQEITARFGSVRQQNPTFARAQVVLATTYDGYFVYGTQDIRTRVLAALGFTSPPDLDTVIGDRFGANISAERADLLDTDVAIWLVPDIGAEQAKLHKAPVYGGLDVVKQGREIYIAENTTYGHATSFVTALSLPYLLDRLVPQLTAALDGNPATQVAQPAS